MSWFRRRTDHPTDDDLSALVDGALGRRATAIEGHLEGCGACTARLAELREVNSLLGALPRPVASRSFALGAEHAVSRLRPSARRQAFAFAPAVALSLLVALLAIDFAVVSDGNVNFESRATSDEAASGAGTLSKGTEERALQPAAAPQPATAPAQDSAAGATAQPDSPPTAPTASMEDYAEPAKDNEAARYLIRGLEVVAAIGFVVALAVFVRRRLA